MTTYHFVAASERFLTEEEPLEEVLKERRRHYAEEGKDIDFWLIRRPAFLNSPELSAIKTALPVPSAAVVSTVTMATAAMAPRQSTWGSRPTLSMT